MSVLTNPVIEEIDPSRLESGAYCHRLEKTVGEGDVHASYSADRIGMRQPVRRPFSWRGGPWVCTGIIHKDGTLSAEAYRMIHIDAFDGTPITYAEKTANAEQARNDPMGFHHGMKVQRGGEEFVLAGPPVIFVPGQPDQLSLF
ncbi:MAG: hypothetical protein H6907_09925 [Hyphomicrobiales bacterium]|nr:hypothetical protein [Hyphomicrobiales bacterium]MCP5372036.1 hypothetical protein [Hyphomicrobiales bacterium]